MWKPIDTAPRVLWTRIVAWAPGWDEPAILKWKTNSRVPNSLEYWGDTVEEDDYGMATDPSEQPTHWLEIPPLPY